MSSKVIQKINVCLLSKSIHEEYENGCDSSNENVFLKRYIKIDNNEKKASEINQFEYDNKM